MWPSHRFLWRVLENMKLKSVKSLLLAFSTLREMRPSSSATSNHWLETKMNFFIVWMSRTCLETKYAYSVCLYFNGTMTFLKNANLQKKQCGGVHFWLYGIAYWMPIHPQLHTFLQKWLVHVLGEKQTRLPTTYMCFEMEPSRWFTSVVVPQLDFLQITKTVWYCQQEIVHVVCPRRKEKAFYLCFVFLLPSLL